MYPYHRLKEGGYEVHVAAPSKKKLRFVVHELEPGYDTFTEKQGYSWDADLAFAAVNAADCAALVIPGAGLPSTSGMTPTANVASGTSSFRGVIH